ncbi:sensor histidine kinase [Qipengyuania sp. DSG2-2]|uniref:sensor histidine kinase n=1 Tax=Qipengyuania sp. DGS2-2 TaxID=3349631 RepID=UPI0036D43A73
MAVLPFRPTRFFENKNRAFWNLQLAGWGGAFTLRAVSGFAGGQELSFFAVILIEAITGLSISLILSTVFRQLLGQKPVVTWVSTAAVLAVSVVVFAFIQTWVIDLTRPDNSEFASLFIGYSIYPLTLLGAWSALYYAINFFLQIEEQADQLERLEAQATAAQLAMLRYQLNPHFLFNTLNSISTLVLLKQTDPANAMLTRLSSFLRHTLITNPSGKVTLKQEIATIQLYLEIERMRFEDRLRTEFDIEDEAARACLPAMLLQPLVENAIKYAVGPQEEGAKITLRANRTVDRLRIIVSDTGPGLQKRRKGDVEGAARGDEPGTGGTVSTGVGLPNIRDRLGQAYGSDHLFEIRSPPEGGFSVLIEIPYEREEPDESAEPALVPPSTAPAASPQSTPQPEPAPAAFAARGKPSPAPSVEPSTPTAARHPETGRATGR